MIYRIYRLIYKGFQPSPVPPKQISTTNLILFEAVKNRKPVSSSEHFTMLNKSCKGFPFKRRRRRAALLRSPGRRCTLQSQVQDIDARTAEPLCQFAKVAATSWNL